MRLNKLTIRNYKSLRNITISPTSLAVLLGPNASGKSNFSDAIHFLSEIHGQGLETAIARKGGYENIAFRKQRRSKSSIDFEVVIDATARDIAKATYAPRKYGDNNYKFRICHKFSVVASGGGIRAAFRVSSEELTVAVSANQSNDRYSEIVKIHRGLQRDLEIKVSNKEELALGIKNEKYRVTLPDTLTDQSLFINGLYISGIKSAEIAMFPRYITRVIADFKAYQFTTSPSRNPGVPTPNPILSYDGENLPAIVDWLQRKHPEKWEIVMSAMRDVLPGLTEINVQYLHTKRLGVFFQEEGFGRPWGVDEVSDGTVQSLVLLVAAVDPRSSFLVIEEPENSVHPWILRVIVNRLREVSKSKNVIITSHSPTLVNLLSPDEIWLISRKKGESQINRLIDLEPLLAADWKKGAYLLSDFLDTGAVPQAVPGGVW